MIIEKGSNIFELISMAHANNIYEGIIDSILPMKTYTMKIIVIDAIYAKINFKIE